jgi:hypothetical protein
MRAGMGMGERMTDGGMRNSGMRNADMGAANMGGAYMRGAKMRATSGMTTTAGMTACRVTGRLCGQAGPGREAHGQHDRAAAHREFPKSRVVRSESAFGKGIHRNSLHLAPPTQDMEPGSTTLT